MSGHSKWKSIQHKKGALDAKRGKLFAKLAKEIYVAAKNGEANIDNNPTLRLAVEKAKAQSMPKENIDRAIKRASGSQSNENYEEILYEGYGAHGIAIMCFCLTDNKNRTAAFIKSTFTKRKGNLAASGAVSYLFVRQGMLVMKKKDIKVDYEEFELKLLDYDIIDVIEEQETITVYLESKKFEEVKEQIAKLGVSFIKSEITMVPQSVIKLSAENQEQIVNLIEILEDNDDVQEVYHNMEIKN